MMRKLSGLLFEQLAHALLLKQMATLQHLWPLRTSRMMQQAKATQR